MTPASATGSRQAIVGLAELRLSETVMFAKQANVTSGPQQVNNGVVGPAVQSYEGEFPEFENWPAL